MAAGLSSGLRGMGGLPSWSSLAGQWYGTSARVVNQERAANSVPTGGRTGRPETGNLGGGSPEAVAPADSVGWGEEEDFSKMARFDELMGMSLEKVAAHRAMSDHPGGHEFMRADSILRLREVEAVTEAARQTRRYARFTFWVAVFTALTALGTLLVPS